jgi:hypothetical protein
MWSVDVPAADRRDLKTVLRALAGAGYTCFWQGDSGDLAQASGDRWCDAFEWRGHSNLVCAHAPRLIQALRAWDCTADEQVASGASHSGVACARTRAQAHPLKQHAGAYVGR